MKLYLFFGLPGAGKSYAGKVAEKYFGYHVYEGDSDLTEELHTAFQNQSEVSDNMRDVFFNRLIQSTKKLQQQFDKLVITQTFIKEKYREQFLHEISEAEFVLIETETNIRESRLAKRKEYPLDKEYARKMTKLFEKPSLKYQMIKNTTDGEEFLKEQLKQILV